MDYSDYDSSSMYSDESVSIWKLFHILIWKTELFLLCRRKWFCGFMLRYNH